MKISIANWGSDPTPEQVEGIARSASASLRTGNTYRNMYRLRVNVLADARDTVEGEYAIRAWWRGTGKPSGAVLMFWTEEDESQVFLTFRIRARRVEGGYSARSLEYEGMRTRHWYPDGGPKD